MTSPRTVFFRASYHIRCASGDADRRLSKPAFAGPDHGADGYNAGKSAIGKQIMSWLGIVVAVICLYLAFKVVAFMLKLLLWTIVLGGVYVFLAPMLGMPSLF